MISAEPEPAYVIRVQPWRETSFLVEFFCAQLGRVGAIARGLRGARAQPQRAVLQPLQPLRVVLRGRGELLRMAAVEPAGTAPRLAGARVLAGLYLNELLMRLLPRHDAQPALFWSYASCLGELEQTAALAWTLRRFERDLLAAVGYGLRLEVDHEGAALQDHAFYRYLSDSGAVRAAATGDAIPGAALNALREGRAPSDALLPPLRRLLRRLIGEQLGDRGLQSWGLLAELDEALQKDQAVS